MTGYFDGFCLGLLPNGFDGRLGLAKVDHICEHSLAFLFSPSSYLGDVLSKDCFTMVVFELYDQYSLVLLSDRTPQRMLLSLKLPQRKFLQVLDSRLDRLIGLLAHIIDQIKLTRARLEHTLVSCAENQVVRIVEEEAVQVLELDLVYSLKDLAQPCEVCIGLVSSSGLIRVFDLDDLQG